MKKLLLGIALALVAGSSFAQKLTFSPASFELKAGQSQIITVSLEGAAVDAYKGLSMTLELPDNLELVRYRVPGTNNRYWITALLPNSITTEIDEGEEIENTEEVDAFQASTDYTFFRKGHQYTEHDDSTDTEIPGRVSTRDELNVVFYNTKGFTFPKQASMPEPLFLFQIRATDKCYTETQSFDADVVFTTAASESEVAKFPKASEMTYAIEYKLPKGGFGTLDWPVALDFSKNDFTLVGTGRLSKSGNMAINDGAKQFAAAEPIIIWGKEGTYNLYTTRDEVAKDSENVLEGTVDAPLKVSGTSIFALADMGDAGIGFFRCKDGIEIPQYKAYYTDTNATVESFIFEGTSGIREALTGNDANETYTISGVKVNNTTKKGVYIVNGKKVVVK